MKKIYLLMAILGLTSAVTGVSELVQTIAQNDPAGVNYGNVIFPVLLCVFSFWMYRRKE